MEKLIEKVDNLIDKINEEECVKSIRKLNKEIFNDKKLIDLVNKYNTTGDVEAKKKLFENEKFQLYKDLEMDVNLLIMKINNKLKEISKGSSCDR